MLIKDIFEQYGYQGLLTAGDYEGIKADYFKENGVYPEELQEIYISSTRDELFFVLILDGMDAQSLCDDWDRKISSFISFGSKKKEILLRLKYNIVQIILYRGMVEKKELEHSLFISRKIFIPYLEKSNNDVELSEEQMIYFPFIPVEQGNYIVDEELEKELASYLPKTTELEFLNIEKKQARNNKKVLEPSLSFEDEEFTKIEGWLLNNDNTIG